MADSNMKKSQSIKNLNTRLLKFAIEEIDIPKKKDRTGSVVDQNRGGAFLGSGLLKNQSA